MDKLIRFGIDFGMDSLKFAYAGCVGNVTLYGRLATSHFYSSYPSLGYYDQDAERWIFGNEVLDAKIKTFETVVEIKQLLNMLNSDETSPAYYTSTTFNKYGSEISKASRKNYMPTFECKDTPKTVVEQFFAAAMRDFFAPALEKLKESQSALKLKYAYECQVTYPYNADDRYKIELKRLIESTGFTVSKMMPEPTMAGMYAYVLNPTDLIRQQALLVDIGASRTSTALIEFAEWGVETKKFYPSVSLGGKDYDNAVGDWARRRSGRGEELSSMQKYNLSARTKTAKEYLGLAEQTIVEYDSEVTLHVPLSRDDFTENSLSVTEKICASVKSCAGGELGKIKYMILSGGGSQTYGLSERLGRAAGSGITVLRLNCKVNGKATVFDPVGCESAFAAALGAALSTTGKYLAKSVAPLSYGTDVVQNGVKMMNTIVSKNTPIPLRKEVTYYATGRTRSVSVDLFSSQETGTFVPLSQTTTLINQKLEYTTFVDRGHPLKVIIEIDESGIGRARAESAKAKNKVSSEFSIK